MALLSVRAMETLQRILRAAMADYRRMERQEKVIKKDRHQWKI